MELIPPVGRLSVFPRDDTQVKVTGPEEVPSEAGVSVMYVLTCVAGLHEACKVLLLPPLC